MTLTVFGLSCVVSYVYMYMYVVLSYIVYNFYHCISFCKFNKSKGSYCLMDLNEYILYRYDDISNKNKYLHIF